MSFNYDAIAQVARAICNFVASVSTPKFQGALAELNYPISADMFEFPPRPGMLALYRNVLKTEASKFNIEEAFLFLSIELYNQHHPHGLTPQKAYARPYIWYDTDGGIEFPLGLLWETAGLQPGQGVVRASEVFRAMSNEGYMPVLFRNMEMLFFKIHHGAKSRRTFNHEEFRKMGVTGYLADRLSERGFEDKKFDTRDFDFSDLEYLVNAILIVYAGYVYVGLRRLGARVSFDTVANFMLEQKWKFVGSLF